MDVVKDLLSLNQDIMGVLLSDSFAIYEYVFLLSQQSCESRHVDALVPHSRWEELRNLPEGSECVQRGKVRRVEEVEGRKFAFFFEGLKFFFQYLITWTNI